MDTASVCVCRERENTETERERQRETQRKNFRHQHQAIRNDAFLYFSNFNLMSFNPLLTHCHS